MHDMLSKQFVTHSVSPVDRRPWKGPHFGYTRLGTVHPCACTVDLLPSFLLSGPSASRCHLFWLLGVGIQRWHGDRRCKREERRGTPVATAVVAVPLLSCCDDGTNPEAMLCRVVHPAMSDLQGLCYDRVCGMTLTSCGAVGCLPCLSLSLSLSSSTRTTMWSCCMERCVGHPVCTVSLCLGLAVGVCGLSLAHARRSSSHPTSVALSDGCFKCSLLSLWACGLSLSSATCTTLSPCVPSRPGYHHLIVGGLGCCDSPLSSPSSLCPTHPLVDVERVS